MAEVELEELEPEELELEELEPEELERNRFFETKIICFLKKMVLTLSRS